MRHVLDYKTGTYRYLMLLPGGTKMTVFTKAAGPARTNRVAELVREHDDFGDWQIVRRSQTADASLLPETFGDGVISARDLADALDSNHDLWADVNE